MMMSASTSLVEPRVNTICPSKNTSPKNSMSVNEESAAHGERMYTPVRLWNTKNANSADNAKNPTTCQSNVIAMERSDRSNPVIYSRDRHVGLWPPRDDN